MLKLIVAKVGSEEQLEKEAFRMAAGGEQGCALASDRELQTQLRQLWKEWLEACSLSSGAAAPPSPTASLAGSKRDESSIAESHWHIATGHCSGPVVLNAPLA